MSAKPKRRPPTVDTAGAQAAETGVARMTQPVDAEVTWLPLEQIGDRPAGDTRDLNPAQVEQLRQSIAEVGLIAPLAVDRQGRLLAGGHRRAALQQLREADLPRFNDLFQNGIPCRRFPFDAAADPAQALQVEITENEKRRNYTRAEIVAVAERLQAQGYSRSRGRGNQQPLIPALMTAFGVHRATIHRALQEESNDAAATFEDQPRKKKLTLAADLVDQLRTLAKEDGTTVEELATVILQQAIAQRQGH